MRYPGYGSDWLPTSIGAAGNLKEGLKHEISRIFVAIITTSRRCLSLSEVLLT